jgi:hypothetical protein
MSTVIRSAHRHNTSESLYRFLHAAVLLSCRGMILESGASVECGAFFRTLFCESIELRFRFPRGNLCLRELGAVTVSSYFD